MQITLNQDEITAAVEAYVHSQINISEDQEISIDFTAGRSPNGLTASLEIRASGTKTVVAPAPVTEPVVAEAAKPAAKPVKKANPNVLQKPPVEEVKPEPEVTSEPEAEADTPEEPMDEPAPKKSIFSKAS